MYQEERLSGADDPAAKVRALMDADSGLCVCVSLSKVCVFVNIQSHCGGENNVRVQSFCSTGSSYIKDNGFSF